MRGQWLMRDLPPLTGSPKQVAWAIRLRARMLADMDRLIASKKLPPNAVSAHSHAARIRIAARLPTDARYWTDRQQTPVELWMHELGKNAQ
jgi:hypothetical protein